MLDPIDDVYKTRLSSVRALLIGPDIDALLIGSPANRRWISGFTGSAGWLLISKETALLATDFRYWDQAGQEAPLFDLYKITDQLSREWDKFIGQSFVAYLGVESQHLSVKNFNDIDEATDVRLIPLKETVEPLREVKISIELDEIKRAAEITDEVMDLAPGFIKPGVSERELAWKLERELRERGAHSLAFSIIVASGTNGAMAHHHPGERKFGPGDSIIIDMGARVNDYNSDLTRTFLISGESNDEFMRLYNLVLDAQQAALTGIRAGITGKAADQLARSKIEEGGYGPEFGHSLGHGIGLEVHENPRLSSKGKPKSLLSGMVVTVEPGIYISDWGGIRIEDLVVINDSGVENLSRCAKRPLISA